MIISKTIFLISLELLCATRFIYGAAPPENPFSSSLQAQTVIQAEFKDIALHPNVDLLLKLDYYCMRVPGNTRVGRDIKLTLMLQFMTLIDSLWENKKLKIGPYPVIPSDLGVIIPGEDPSNVSDPVIRAKYVELIKAHNVLIDYCNFQTELGILRHKYSKEIPGYIGYNYTSTEKDHIESIVLEQLKNDAKAKDLFNELLAAEPLLPPESIPPK